MTKKTSPAYRASKEETIPINKLHPYRNKKSGIIWKSQKWHCARPDGQHPEDGRWYQRTDTAYCVAP